MNPCSCFISSHGFFVYLAAGLYVFCELFHNSIKEVSPAFVFLSLLHSMLVSGLCEWFLGDFRSFGKFLINVLFMYQMTSSFSNITCNAVDLLLTGSEITTLYTFFKCVQYFLLQLAFY